MGFDTLQVNERGLELGLYASSAKKYDIVYLGVNITEGHYAMVPKGFIETYYEEFKWLVRFAEENPTFNVNIQHHSNHKDDPKELEILNGSKVITLKHINNSYEIAEQARLRLVNFSTMGFEMEGHGYPCLFLNGKVWSKQWTNLELVKLLWINSYEDFSRRALVYLNF